MNQKRRHLSPLSRRALKVESLERRELFAADIYHGASQHSSSHHQESSYVAPTNSPNSSSSASKSELSTEIRNTAGAKVEFQIEKGKLEISIERAQPRTSYEVSLGGNTVATLVTDAKGKASLKTATPDSVATAIAGDIVTVAGIGSGSLSLHGNSHTDTSVSSTKLKAAITGVGTGKAEFEIKGSKQKFEVEIRGLSANTSYDVTIDGVVVGKLTTNKSGKGELKFDNSKGQPFPANFPVLTGNSVISVGSASSGSFKTSLSSGHK